MMNGGMMGAGGNGMMSDGMMSGTCPMNVPGAAVAVADIDGGVALTFTTNKPSEVAELRSRVKRMTDMHGSGGMMGGGMMGGGMMGSGGAGMMSGRMMTRGPMPEATATSEDVDGGARLVLKPKDAAKLDALREHVKARAEHMQQGRCPMMTAREDTAPSAGK